MATRNLKANQNKTDKTLKKIEKDASKSIRKNYKLALALIRAELLKVIEKHGQIDNEVMSKFGRKQKLNQSIRKIIRSMFTKVNKKIIFNSDTQYKQGYFRNAWAVDQNIGVALDWKIE